MAAIHASTVKAKHLLDDISACHETGVSAVGPPLQLFICGAAIRSIFVFGPLMLNSTINFTTVSNAESLDIGITSSPGVLPDLHELSDYVLPAAAAPGGYEREASWTNG